MEPFVPLPEIPQEVVDQLRELAPAPSPARRKQLDKIRALPETERELLQLLSIIYSSVARTPLAQCMTKAGIRVGNSRTITTTVLDPLLNRLQTDGLISEAKAMIRCVPAIAEIMTRETIRSGRFEAMADAVKIQFQRYSRSYYQSYPECLRELRLAFYRRDEKSLAEVMRVAASQFSAEIGKHHPFEVLCLDQFDPEWFVSLSPDIITLALDAALWGAFERLEPSGIFAYQVLEILARNCPQQFPELGYSVAFELIVRGRANEALPFLESYSGSSTEGLRGFVAFLQGDDATAIARYEAGLALLKKASGKRKIFYTDFSGYFFILSLIRSARPERLEQAREYVEIVNNRKGVSYSPVYWLLGLFVTFLQGQQSVIKNLESSPLSRISDPMVQLFYALILYWIGSKRADDHINNLTGLAFKCRNAGYDWLAAEAMHLQAVLNNIDEGEPPFFPEHGQVSMVSLIKRRTSWENALEALIGLGRPEEKAAVATPKQGSRLVWELHYNENHVTVQPLEQKLSASGAWSKGRNVALKRLKNEADQIDYLSLQDRNVCLSIVHERYSYYGGEQYYFDTDRALPALVGHPLLFLDAADNQRLELVRGEPEVQVTRKRGHVLLTMTHELAEQRSTLVFKESATRWKVMEITQEHRRIASVLGKDGLKVPVEAEERVKAAIAALATRLTIHSDIGGNLPVEAVAADGRIVAQLRPHGAGLVMELLVRPFGETGPAFRPGHGGETVVAELSGKRLQTRRDLATESAAAKRVVTAIPTLECAEGDGDWLLDDPEDCLELLLELKELEGEVVVFWPEGERLRVSRTVSSSRLSLSIKHAKDWFAVNGELAVDDNLVLDMKRLVELVGNSTGRFLPLEDGTFVALTKEFRRRLDELRAYSEEQGKGVRIHPLAAPALEDFLAEAGKVTVDSNWKKLLERLRSGEALNPKVPSTFQGALRDYQTEGFGWLARLAHWGVGACLADDMGLGKTLQSLALILTRAGAGPTLVVAPTSVCMNWEAETIRFAPTLTVRPFGPGDREKFLNSLQPFDLVVCSYTLLQQEAELLTGVRWETVVLDEAQAIKNMATQRSQAAMNLQAGFRLITTGTPLENHLGELWNLFRFINPGLLGSHRSFTERFANPIERNQHKKARNHLKKLIRPFILRRTKNQVLEELPSRTEITYHVELGTEEMAFYEALRRQSLERIAQADDPGQIRFQILAELMKLRRACCNPRLVMPDVGLSGAKLAAFAEIVTELRDNGHKALVFSQFVDHLAILRAELDRLEISYQYLDGSTQVKERKRAVDSFQAGDGELFLISLKAGGAGLNLTAADYVIHMDPWWNPAVEDQASDRAHRIGQQRPVTIYRLVTRHTIEEQIVDLHRTKRDLADSLLEGSDMGSRVTAEDLLALLKENR